VRFLRNDHRKGKRIAFAADSKLAIHFSLDEMFGDPLVNLDSQIRAPVITSPAVKFSGPNGSLSMFSDAGRVRDSKQENIGLDAKSRGFGDVIKAGVIDPLKIIPRIAERRLYRRTAADHRTLDRQHQGRGTNSCRRSGTQWPEGMY
jgi:hypothetical protein